MYNLFITLSGYAVFPSVFKCGCIGSLKFCTVKSKFFVGFSCCRAEQVTGSYWLQISDVKTSPSAKEQKPAIFLSVSAVIDAIDSLINDIGKEPDELPAEV